MKGRVSDVGGETCAVAYERVGTVMANNNLGDINDLVFLTIAEVAARMRVSKMTVYRLVHSAELPAVRVGRSFRIAENDVNEYLRKSYYNAG